MCRFKSGIVTKDGRVIAPIGVDSHNDIFKQAGIKDDGKNAVPVEFYPDTQADFFKPDKYHLRADCDIVPPWFTATRRRDAEQQMRRVVQGMVRDKRITVDSSLDLSDRKRLPRGFALIATRDLFLDRLTKLPEGTSLKGRSLWLGPIKAIGKRVRLTAEEVWWHGRYYKTTSGFRRAVARAAERTD